VQVHNSVGDILRDTKQAIKSWRTRCAGKSKLKIKEMGSRYLFICLYVWLEKYFSRSDYRKANDA
jgi:hypothetical protein